MPKPSYCAVGALAKAGLLIQAGAAAVGAGAAVYVGGRAAAEAAAPKIGDLYEAASDAANRD